MPALKPTDYKCTITYLGTVPNRQAQLASNGVQGLELSFAGPKNESRGGLTRPSDSRVLSQYERGTEIRNTRQLSIISAEDLDKIARNMGVDALKPEWLGATVCVRGLPDFSFIPPSARLQSQTGMTLTIDMQNRPCTLPAPVIDAHFPGQGKLFKSAAVGLRGVTAWVEREGVLNVGDILTLHIPDQREWQPFLA